MIRNAPPDIENKRCISCDAVKPLSDFQKRYDVPNGFRNQCRLCRKSNKIDFNAPFKRCSECHVLKENNLINFNYSSKKKKSVFRAQCKTCKASYRRRLHLETKYNLSIEEYNDMIANQNNKCEICKKETVLFVDHDHENGKIRALLCDKCNRGIGMFDENCMFLQSAIDFILKHSQESV